MKRIIEESGVEIIDESPKKKLITPKNIVVVNNSEILQKKNNSNPQQEETKLYRLTIEIDRVYLRPCPKSKKKKQIKIITEFCSLEKQNSLVQKQAQGDKKSERNLHQCLICKRLFTIATDLYSHIKEHFTCDICATEFTSPKILQKHFKIHESLVKQFPYSCHICGILFKTKELIRKHDHIKLDKYSSDGNERIQYCKSCNMTFRNETTFRKHLGSHVEKVKIVQICGFNSLPVRNEISSDCIKAVAFTCRICNKSFTSITEIDKHTKLHIDNMKPDDNI